MRPILAVTLLAALAAPAATAAAANWYEESFYLLHEDHHTQGTAEVGRDADPAETARLVALSRPDVVQIHAKGNPGWTTYPTKIGFTPPKLVGDVLGLWRNMARRDGYHFSIYYNIGRDGEIMQRHPAWNRVQANGQPWDRALCYHSGVAEEYLWPMIREEMAGYKPDGFWFDGSCFTVRQCYCDVCRERFQREQNLPAPKKPEDPGWAAYQEMQRQIYREFVHRTCVEIHKIDPQCLVAVNWAYSLRMPEKPDEGIPYLTGDIGNHVEGLSAEGHWYDSQGLPFDLMTQINTMPGVPWHDGKGAARRTRPKPKPQIQQEMAIIVANGGRYFAWDTPTPESGLVPERLEFVGRVVAPLLRARQPWCLGTQRVADVSLLHSAAAHYAQASEATAVFSKRNNRIDGAADWLPRLHLNYEMVPDWRLAEQDVRSPVLVVEHPRKLTKETVGQLVAFVENGGTLLLTGMGVKLDPRLPKLLGIDQVEASDGPVPLTVTTGDTVHRFDHWLYRLKLAGAESLMEAKTADGSASPLLTRNIYGRGRGYYAALPLLTQHGKQVVPAELMQAVFAAVAPPESRALVTDAPETVEVVLRRRGNHHILHLVNMAPGEREVVRSENRTYTTIQSLPPVPKCHVSIPLPAKPARVELQPQGIAVENWQYEDGRLEADLPGFEVHQMVVLVGGQK